MNGWMMAVAPPSKNQVACPVEPEVKPLSNGNHRHQTESFQNRLWSYKGNRLSNSEIHKDATIHIHPAFWRVLGTQKLASK